MYAALTILVIFLISALIVLYDKGKSLEAKKRLEEYRENLRKKEATNVQKNASTWNNIYKTKIAGINYSEGIDDLLGKTLTGMLIAEPMNIHDSNAIEIVYSSDGRHIGYIPKNETLAVRQFVPRLPFPCIFHIDEFDDYDDGDDIRTYLYGQVLITN